MENTPVRYPVWNLVSLEIWTCTRPCNWPEGNVDPTQLSDIARRTEFIGIGYFQCRGELATSRKSMNRWTLMATLFSTPISDCKTGIRTLGRQSIDSCPFQHSHKHISFSLDVWIPRSNGWVVFRIRVDLWKTIDSTVHRSETFALQAIPTSISKCI